MSLKTRIRKLEEQTGETDMKVIVLLPDEPEPSKAELEEASVVFRVKYESPDK